MIKQEVRKWEKLAKKRNIKIKKGLRIKKYAKENMQAMQ